MLYPACLVVAAPADAALAAEVIAALQARGVTVQSADGASSEQDLIALIEQYPAFVPLLSPATRASVRAVMASNLAYLRWLQQDIAVYAPVQIAPMGADDFGFLLYRQQPDPDGAKFKQQFALVDGVGVPAADIADRLLTFLTAPGKNIAPRRPQFDPNQRVTGMLPRGGADVTLPADAEPQPGADMPASEREESPADERARGITFGTGAPPPPVPQPMPAAPPAPMANSGAAWETQAPGAPPPARVAPPEIADIQPAAPAQVASAAPPPPAAQASPALDVTCTAYHPKEVAPKAWETLLVYLALDTPQTLAAVAADAAERLVRRADAFRPVTAPGSSRLRRGAQLTIVPMLPGFECNPSSLPTRWEEDVQRHEFRIRATTAPAGQAVNGNVSIFAGGILFAEIPLSIYVQQASGRSDIPGGFASQMVRAYRKVFASYAHRDTDIVRLCRAAAEATGDRYLMDITLLRSGQQWNEALMQAISEADLFQLFWSEAAAASEHVRHEWQYALQLAPLRPAFIRPVFWAAQPYQIPPDLNAIHFERIDLAKLGFMRAQPFWKAWFNRA